MLDANALSSSGAPSSPESETEVLSALLKSPLFDRCERGDPCSICRIHLLRSQLIELRMLLERQAP